MKKIIFISLGIILLAGGVIVAFGFFPVANVGEKLIWYKDVSNIQTAFDHFKQKTAGSSNPALTLGQDDKTTRRAILEGLIIQVVVDNAIGEFGREAIEKEVEETMQQASQTGDRAKLEEAVRELYGMEFTDFEVRLLRPQAKEIVLRKRVEASGVVYSTWLEEKLKNTNVNIYFLSYRWQDGELKDK